MRTLDLLSLAVAFVGVVAPVPTLAASCPSSLGTAQQVVCLQEQNAVLQQQLSNAQIAQSLAKLNGGSLGRNLGLPSVSAIFGRAGKLRAMLTWLDADGNAAGSLDVSAGATLPGGLAVVKVLPGRVVLSDGHHTHVLLMAGGGGNGSRSAVNARADAAAPTPSIAAGAIPPLPAGR